MERTLPLQVSVAQSPHPITGLPQPERRVPVALQSHRTARRVAVSLAGAAVIAFSLAVWRRLADLIPRDDELPFSCSLD